MEMYSTKHDDKEGKGLNPCSRVSNSLTTIIYLALRWLS